MGATLERVFPTTSEPNDVGRNDDVYVEKNIYISKNKVAVPEVFCAGIPWY